MNIFISTWLVVVLGTTISKSVIAQTKSVLNDESLQELKEKIQSIGINVDGNENIVGDVDKSEWYSLDLNLSKEETELVQSLLEKVKKDPESLTLISKLKTVQGPTLEAMKDGMAASEKVQQLKKILSEMQAVETLFQDPQRALKMMNEDGMISKDKLPLYEKNPQLLENDTRKGLYFSFLTMAVVLELL
jgi:hypothetical protein